MTERPDDSSVRVALRIRPQLAKERIDMCQVCTSVTPDSPQVFLGKDKGFTYDFVFDLLSSQHEIYDNVCRPLIEGTFEGYNATILAYGQTGSGKTYSMGTGFDVSQVPEEIGIIPRAVEHLFKGIEERRQNAIQNNRVPPEFKVNAQFMELYNEEIIDLLDTTRDPSEKGRKSHIKIHEDAHGGIYTVGVTTRQVVSLQDTIQCLRTGSLCRSTASTNMNAQSSRSHAIFTLHIKQQRVVSEEVDGEGKENNEGEEIMNEFETLTAKFHFVDLAGSERLKRTGATGERAKEGISINCGLLALGNVISALGDVHKKGSHVPYRDSKLTRLLQDSLGGNSQTLMLACVSPSDRDFVETLNTMKYANRARNIKNKVSVNQDKTSRQIAELRAQVLQLQEELLDYKQGKRMVDPDGVESFNDMFHENTMLQTENDSLRQRIKAMQTTMDSLTAKNTELLAERVANNITNVEGGASSDEVSKLIAGYIREIEELRTKLIESQSMADQIQRSASRAQSRFSSSSMTRSAGPMLGLELSKTPENDINNLIQEAKKDIKQLKRKTKMSTSQSVKKVLSKALKTISEHENQSEEEKQDHESAEDKEKKSSLENGEEEEEDGDDEEEEEEEEELSSDSDSDEVFYEENTWAQEYCYDDDDDEESDELHANLADLSCEISIKERLIEELELSQKRLHSMKVQYEEKLLTLSARIRQTEVERDKVLTNIGSVETESSDKSKRVRDQYEKKLNDMQNEVKKLQAAKKEHAKLMRNQAHYEKQLGSLQRELGDMKKTKVKLINQIKEDSQKNRQVELRRSKEIAQLKKDQRKKDNMLKSMEIEKRNKEIILKRKQEEVEALRKRQKPMSTRTAGRVGQYNRPQIQVSAPVPLTRRRPIGTKFSAKQAKQKWDNVERNLTSAIVKKQTLAHMERDMERWMKGRVSLGKKLDKLTKKHDKAVAENADPELLKEIEDQMNSIKTNVAFVQEQINDCQTNIMQMEETKDQGIAEPSQLFEAVSLEEAKYMLEHFVNMVVSKGLFAAQKESETKELSARLHQERIESALQRDMLQYLIQDHVDIDIDDSLLRSRDDESESESEDGSRSPSPVESLLMKETQFQPLNAVSATMMLPSPTNGGPTNGEGLLLLPGRPSVKARRKTATPEDLLYAGTTTETNKAPSLPLVEEESNKSGKKSSNKSTDASSPVSNKPTTPLTTVSSNVGTGEEQKKTEESTLMPPPKTALVRQAPPTVVTKQNGIQRQNNSTGTTNNARAELTPSPGVMRKSYPPQAKTTQPEKSPTTTRRKAPQPPGSTGSLSGSLSRQSSISDTCTTDTTPPSSPVPNRRHGNREENVFSRLTSQTKVDSPVQDRGSIKPVGRLAKSSPLVHTHTASGHSRAVLSVFATDELLFSSSKDRTGKMWDLNTGQEMLTLSGHPNNVVAIRYSEETRLVYTVSTYYIKVWDTRTGNKCIKTLTSSGMTSDGALTSATTSRQVTCPPGETNINDVAVNSTGAVLYSAAGSTVRIWDLRGFKPVGKLSGGHQAAVMVLAVDDTDTAEGNICVVTGSKDHYIKVFEMDEDSTGVMTPKCNLEPPHYDGIQSLCLMGDLLFSGSRDMCIKKWNLAEQQLAQSINNAHKDWVCGLSFMPGGNCLLSGCRGGIVKLWHIDTCNLVGEVKAHSSPINSVATNSCLIFTASNEGGIKIWEPAWDLLPEYVQDFYS